MEAGLAEFGDVDFMIDALKEVRLGTEKGQIYAQGTARVGEHFEVARVPVIKKQAISAYDPRSIEGTGISMMSTAQGADHTAGNLPRLNSHEMELEELLEQSLDVQTTVAATDSIGLCIFGRSVTDVNYEFLAESANGAHGTDITPDFFRKLGQDALVMEKEFNKQAGFGEKDDELPDFFYTEPLPPTNHVMRFHAKDVQNLYDPILA